MVTINGGSIALDVFNSIDPMPNNVSGLLATIVDKQRFFIENFTGDTIGNTIAEKYQSPLTDLTTAEVLKLMAVQDLGVNSVTIGELKTSNENLLKTSDQLHEKAVFELKSLSKGIKFFKARG